MHFPHDALIITMHIGSCQVSRILIDSGSSVNILYGSAMDNIEDTLEIARAMICPQTQSNLYEFDENETRSPSITAFLVRADPYSVITEFYMIDVESPHNVILGRLWIHMIKVVPSSYHQLLRYPTLTGTVGIRGTKPCPRASQPLLIKVRMESEACQDSPQPRPPSGEVAKTSRHSIAIT